MTIPTDIAPLIGSWRHAAPWDSDDYLAEYSVKYEEGKVVVTGRDLQDGEEFVISEVSWDGEVFRFRSLMPSTCREGINEFRVLRDGVIESRFTFTVVEEMHRAST